MKMRCWRSLNWLRLMLRCLSNCSAWAASSLLVAGAATLCSTSSGTSSTSMRDCTRRARRWSRARLRAVWNTNGSMCSMGRSPIARDTRR
ncbi:hypothetical protein D9M69_683960 [compost metagenome]